MSEKRTGTAEDTPEDDMDHDAWEMMMYKRRTIWGRVHHFVESIVEHQDFEMFVILLIFANCIVLAMYRPLEPALSPWNK